MNLDKVKRRTRAKFLPEEDEKLRALVAELGEDSWEIVASRLPGRNVRQCRERWKHYLSSEKPKEPWTPLEDELLLKKVQEMGGKWTKIARCLKGRTDLQVKTRWQKIFNGRMRMFPKRLRVEAPAPVNTNHQTAVQPPRAVEEDNDTLYTELFDDWPTAFETDEWLIDWSLNYDK